jgi:hypothetical protein
MHKSLFLSLAPLLLSACGGSDVTVGVSARVGVPQATAAAAPGTVRQQVVLANGIEVERVRVVVRKLELEGAGVGSGDDDSDGGFDDSDGGSDDSSGRDGEFETGPFLIDLSGAGLEGQLVALPQVQVPAGSYEEIEYKIGVPSASQVNGDSALLDMAQRQASVLIEGKIDGEPFSFASGVSVEQEREVRFEVGGAGNESITISLDPTRWFLGEGGTRLDPRQEENRSRIENNLQRSIDAFDDCDHDGREDHDNDGSDDD